MKSFKKINRIIIIFIAVCFRYVSLFYSSTFLNYFLLFLLFILTVLNILTIKFEDKKIRKIFILLILSAFIFLLNNEDSLFIYMFAALAFLDKDKDVIIKYFLGIVTVAFIITILSGQLGIIDTVTAGRFINNETVYRNSLGFGNVNTPFIYFMGIIFGLYYFFRKQTKKLIFIYILTTIIALWIFKETDCRTGMYIYVLFIIFSLIYNEKINNKLKPIIPYFFIIFTILSIMLTLFFGGTIHNPVNELLSNRPYFSHYYLENFLFINLFGHDVVGIYVLDNFYLSLLVKTGIISYLVYLYIFYKGSIEASKDYRLVLIIIFTLIYGILECNLYGNFIFVILLKYVLEGDKNGKNQYNSSNL